MEKAKEEVERYLKGKEEIITFKKDMREKTKNYFSEYNVSEAINIAITQARKGYVKIEDAQKEILSYFDIKKEDKATVHAVLKCIELMQEQGDKTQDLELKE